MYDNHGDEVLITNIQRMCFHDGPGIRTTVFLKGCNLHCPWCANPENIDFNIQQYVKKGKEGVYGRLISSGDLLKELLKDSSFYGEDGGVTFSGGEPLLQLNKLKDVFCSLKNRGISIAIESAMQVPYSHWKDTVDYIDYFLVDVKLLESHMCREVLGGNMECYITNIDKLYADKKNITFRIPLNKEYTLREENITYIKSFLKQYSDIPVEIFATHSLGNEKYESLGIKPHQWESISESELDNMAESIRELGNMVIINRI